MAVDKDGSMKALAKEKPRFVIEAYGYSCGANDIDKSILPDFLQELIFAGKLHP